MRVLSLLTAAAVASAAPISVVVSSGEIATWRIGHPTMGIGMTRVEMAQPPSRMGRLCHKMQSSVSRIFAMAGLGPVIPSAAAFAKNVPPPAFPQGDSAHLPVDAMYTSPPIWRKAGTERLGHDHIVPQEHPTLEELSPVARPHGHYHHHNFRPYHRHHGSFLRRVHRALMSLGPWEGRAVAFVLGCGIGVLLRMVWVIGILTYRAFRGPAGEQDEDEASAEYEQVVLVSEELFVAPPEYTDEKVDRAELDVKV